MKIVFFGTPSFSVPFLEHLIRDPGIEVVGVVTQPDKPSGRGGEVTPSPVKTMAQDAVIPFFQPSSLKTDPHIGQTLRDLNADFFVVVAYGKIIPKAILDIPKRGSLNVHPALLPAIGARRRCSGRLPKVTRRPESPSCSWTKAWTQGRSWQAST